METANTIQLILLMVAIAGLFWTTLHQETPRTSELLPRKLEELSDELSNIRQLLATAGGRLKVRELAASAVAALGVSAVRQGYDGRFLVDIHAYIDMLSFHALVSPVLVV